LTKALGMSVAHFFFFNLGLLLSPLMKSISISAPFGFRYIACHVRIWLLSILQKLLIGLVKFWRWMIMIILGYC
jgi:hypothetical protein